MKILLRLLNNKTGATAIEYGLMAALIGVALISGIGAFSTALTNMFELLRSTIAGAGQ